MGSIKIRKADAGVSNQRQGISCHSPSGFGESKILSCPNCGGIVEHEGSCAVCRICGYSECASFPPSSECTNSERRKEWKESAINPLHCNSVMLVKTESNYFALTTFKKRIEIKKIARIFAQVVFLSIF